MPEDLSLKHSPNIVDIVNVEDAVRTVELDYTDLCGMDTLVRVDEHPDVFSCEHCIFQDIIKRLDRDLVCTINTLASIDYEKHSGRVFSCRDCMYKDTISIGLCPISLLSQFHIVR